MKTFQEYIDEIEQHYNKIQDNILSLVPTLQEILEGNPNDRIFIYSFDILKRIIFHVLATDWYCELLLGILLKVCFI